MDECLEYWRTNISERGDPVNRKRDVCCEPFEFSIPDCHNLYQCCHLFRNVPYAEDDERNTEELRAVCVIMNTVLSCRHGSFVRLT